MIPRVAAIGFLDVTNPYAVQGKTCLTVLAVVFGTEISKAVEQQPCRRAGCLRFLKMNLGNRNQTLPYSAISSHQ
jgi:hypothetical protein